MRHLLALLVVVCSAAAQKPVVGDINFYGVHKVSPERILRVIRVHPGDPLPPSKGALEDAISRISGVIMARITAECCNGSATDLFIGIQEKGAPRAEFRSDPAGDVTLPANIVDMYRQYLDAVARAAAAGQAAERLTAGHALSADPQVRAFQGQFVDYAAGHVQPLRDELRRASEPGQRAIAAALIGYEPKKQAAADELQYALQDPDESVRANALRGLAAIGVFAAQNPALGIKISPTWMVELLNSIVLSDRVEAVRTLLILTDHGAGGEALQLIHDRALPAMVEMAEWKSPRYALPPFLLLGRMAGMPDDEVQRLWKQGDRKAVIDRATGSSLRRRR